VCNGTAWVTQSTWAHAGWESIKFGNDTSFCNTGRAGRMRYVGGGTWQYCDGTSWTNFELIPDQSNLQCFNGAEATANSLRIADIPIKLNQVDGDNSFNCGITGRGTVVCGCLDTRCTSFPGLANGVKVAVGSAKACVVKSDNTLTCRDKDNNYDATAAAKTNVIDVDVRDKSQHVCIVKSSGTPNVECWRDDALTPSEVSGIPGTLTTATKIAVGKNHSCALKSDGTVVCWGSAGTVPGGLSGVVDIKATEVSTCALKSDKTISCWGGNSNYTLNIPSGWSTNIDKLESQNLYYCVARQSTNTIKCWGFQSGSPWTSADISYTGTALSLSTYCLATTY
jgi:hypothetical protein